MASSQIPETPIELRIGPDVRSGNERTHHKHWHQGHGPPGSSKDKNHDKRQPKCIPVYYSSIDEYVTAALREAGLESSNLILVIDFTKTNKPSGWCSRIEKHQHAIKVTPNPYEEAVRIIGQTLSASDDDNLIPCFGFGDASAHDYPGFSFFLDKQSHRGNKSLFIRYSDDISLDLPWTYEEIQGLSAPCILMDPKATSIQLDNCFAPKLTVFGLPKLHGVVDTPVPMVTAAGTHNNTRDVKFTVAASSKGGIEIKYGSHVIHVPKYSSVHHPIVQMVLFAHKFHAYVCETDWIYVSSKSESPNIGTVSEFDDRNSIGRRKEPSENQSHHRELGPASKNDSRTCIHMMDGALEIIANQGMVDMYILDSGSTVHGTGNVSLLSERTEEERGHRFNGVGGGIAEAHGSGSIYNDRFQVKDVLYIPGLNQPYVNKTIFSVYKLGELGYIVNFNGATCSVLDSRSWVWCWKTWTWSNEIVGEGRIFLSHYNLDYLRIRLDRAPLSTSEGTGLVKSLWNTASSGWSAITRRQPSHGASSQRPQI